MSGGNGPYNMSDMLRVSWGIYPSVWGRDTSVSPEAKATAMVDAPPSLSLAHDFSLLSGVRSPVLGVLVDGNVDRSFVS